MNQPEDLSFRQDELPEDRSLIIVDDDRAFAQRLVRAMELRGFEVRPGSYAIKRYGPIEDPNVREERVELA